jgi:hypothetical protein
MMTKPSKPNKTNISGETKKRPNKEEDVVQKEETGLDEEQLDEVNGGLWTFSPSKVWDP